MNASTNATYFKETDFQRDYKNNTGVKISVGVTMASVALFTVVANVTVFLAMVQTLVRDARRGLKTVAINSTNSYVTRFLMLSMTVSGVMVGSVIMPLSLLKTLGLLVLSYAQCAVMVYLDYLLCAVSTLHVLFMAVDTYLVICKPLVYRLLSPKAAYAMIAFGWLAPILLTILWSSLQKEILLDCSTEKQDCDQTKDTSIFPFTFGVIFCVLFIAIILLYILIARNVVSMTKKNATGLNQSDPIGGPACLNTNSSESSFVLSQDYSISALAFQFSSQQNTLQVNASKSSVTQTTKKSNKVKCFRFIGAIFTWFAICWLPCWVFIFLCSSCVVCISEWVFLLLDWLTYFSCTVNPILYCRNKSINNAVKYLLCRCLKQK
ncbi:trace amine-associated receptor 5 [Biomphalaria glabrata]|nr:trace amine-associated receptor 5 [Biomphalaria glabrata]